MLQVGGCKLWFSSALSSMCMLLMAAVVPGLTNDGVVAGAWKTNGTALAAIVRRSPKPHLHGQIAESCRCCTSHLSRQVGLAYARCSAMSRFPALAKLLAMHMLRT